MFWFRRLCVAFFSLMRRSRARELAYGLRRPGLAGALRERHANVFVAVEAWTAPR
jgi:hypothetical protein